jgi:cob(I)alamin adenosyltransferase
MPGYVHVYTGDGKGKTTAALGLALRAAGAGWNVFFAQFLKGADSSELDALERFSDRIAVRRFGRTRFVQRNPDCADAECAQRGLVECKEALVSGDYALVILDEANVALALRLFPVEELLAIIDARPEHVELVITGRWAHHRIVNRADLVTDMREVKHYFRQGVLARTGIEK